MCFPIKTMIVVIASALETKKIHNDQIFDSHLLWDCGVGVGLCCASYNDDNDDDWWWWWWWLWRWLMIMAMMDESDTWQVWTWGYQLGICNRWGTDTRATTSTTMMSMIIMTMRMIKMEVLVNYDDMMRRRTETSAPRAPQFCQWWLRYWWASWSIDLPKLPFSLRPHIWVTVW